MNHFVALITELAVELDHTHTHVRFRDFVLERHLSYHMIGFVVLDRQMHPLVIHRQRGHHGAVPYSPKPPAMDQIRGHGP